MYIILWHGLCADTLCSEDFYTLTSVGDHKPVYYEPASESFNVAKNIFQNNTSPFRLQEGGQASFLVHSLMQLVNFAN